MAAQEAPRNVIARAQARSNPVNREIALSLHSHNGTVRLGHCSSQSEKTLVNYYTILEEKFRGNLPCWTQNSCDTHLIGHSRPQVETFALAACSGLTQSGRAQKLLERQHTLLPLNLSL